MLGIGHISGERIDALGTGAAPTEGEQNHLLTCPRCRQLLEAHRAISGVLSGQWATVSAPVRQRPDRRRWLAAQPVTALVSVLIAALVLSFGGLALILSKPNGVGGPSAPPVGNGSNAPSQTPSLPPVSATPTVSAISEPAVVRDALGPFNGWAPDSAHFLAQTADGFGVFERTGNRVGSFTALGGYWLSADTIVAPQTGYLSLYDPSGIEKGQISGDFVGVVTGSNGPSFVAVLPAAGDEAVGTHYRVWDGAQLSNVRDGVPVALSPDGSLIAVLVPLDGAGNGPPGLLGHFSVVDGAGTTLFELSDRVGEARSLFQFSPDGRYLAACFEDVNGGPPQMYAVAVQSASVSDAIGRCGYASWTNDDALYVSLLAEGTHIWTASGVSDGGFPPGTVTIVSSDGRLATWSSGDTTALHTSVSGVANSYQLSGRIQTVAWSPDGRTLATFSAKITNPGGYELALINY